MEAASGGAGGEGWRGGGVASLRPWLGRKRARRSRAAGQMSSFHSMVGRLSISFLMSRARQAEARGPIFTPFG